MGSFARGHHHHRAQAGVIDDLLLVLRHFVHWRDPWNFSRRRAARFRKGGAKSRQIRRVFTLGQRLSSLSAAEVRQSSRGHFGASGLRARLQP